MDVSLLPTSPEGGGHQSTKPAYLKFKIMFENF